MMDGTPRARGRSRGRARETVSEPPKQTLPTQPEEPDHSRAGSSSRPDAPKLPGRTRSTTGSQPTPGPRNPHARVSDIAGDMKQLSLRRPEPKRGKKDVPEYEIIKSRPKGLVTKQGISGTKVKLRANYFRLETHVDWALYQYRVDFSPEEDRTNVKKALLKPHKEIFGNAYLFDGTVLYIANRLSPDPMELFSIRDSDRKKMRITIKSVGDVVMGDYQYLQVFNIIMRKCLDNLQLQMVGRNFFDAKSRVEIKEYKMELWPGYLTSIRQCENSILMCSEITYKVMRCETALDLVRKCSAMSRDWQGLFEMSIIGSIVLTDYNNKTYRIDDVDFQTRPISKFKIRNGEQCTYFDYYKQRYGINIRDKDQPMLVSKAKPREVRAGMTDIIYLVPELCRLTGLTDDMRTNFQLMRALAEHTRVFPKVRIEKLHKFNRRLKENEKVVQDLSSWNMRLSDSLVEFDGRVLNNEVIHFGNKYKVGAGKDADWTKSMRDHAMFSFGPLRTWAIVYFGKTKSEVNNFLNVLSRAASSLQFNITQPEMIEVKNDRSSSYVEVLDAVIARRNPQLILCIVPNNKADRYAAIKKKCCVDRAVPTQVVVAKNFGSKNLMAIATKIAIQINCKLGGIPWVVENPLKGMMVVGYDVCHDASCKAKSFGAMVATLNPTLSRYYSSVTPHTCGEELSNDLAINIVKAIIRYKEYNQGALPNVIIIYRDGVGEGQIPFVYTHEVGIIKDRLADIYNGKPPRMAFVIVTKRLNTRLFLNDNNPPPGTVADDCITSPERYDFFLVSQSVRQGTVSPTAYNVIDDTSGLDADKMQRLTYKMTHLYYNWSGTVRVPAQCQYAHKLAFLVSQCLHRAPNTDLDEVLYFL